MKLLEQYGAITLRRAIVEALQRNTPRASSVALLLRRQPRATPLSLHPQPQSLDIRPHDLLTYVNSPAPKIPTTTNSNLASQLKQIGLRALPTQLDDFIGC